MPKDYYISKIWYHWKTDKQAIKVKQSFCYEGRMDTKPMNHGNLKNHAFISVLSVPKIAHLETELDMSCRDTVPCKSPWTLMFVCVWGGAPLLPKRMVAMTSKQHKDMNSISSAVLCTRLAQTKSSYIVH